VHTLLSSRLLPKDIEIRIYKTIIVPVVRNLVSDINGGTLIVFENRVLRRIFGPKRDEVTGEWRKLHNEELRDLYSSSSIIIMIKSRRMSCAGHVARMGK
jgi:hypothetical protein